MTTAGESMTLVFKRAAIEQLAEPADIFENAERWTDVIGLVSDETPERLSSYADRAGIDPDFLSSTGGQTGGLALARQRFSTERHVFIGTTVEDRQLAESLGWEYLTVTEAAEAANWVLEADVDAVHDDGDDE